MAAITDLSDLVNRLSGGSSGTPETIWFYKDNRTGAANTTDTPSVGVPQSLWIANGIPGTPAAGPGAAAIPVNTTAGGLLQADPSGGRQKWIVSFEAHSSVAGMLMLYDRLFHVSGLSGTTITAQAVQGSPASPALTRYTNGSGNIAWVEVYAAIGGTGRTFTVDYTDQSGNTGNTSLAAAIGGTGELNDAMVLLPIPLASGDSGVQAIKEVLLSASTGTAGNFGVTIAHPLITVPIEQAGRSSSRGVNNGLPVEVLTDACLSLAWWPSDATAPQIYGRVTMVEA